MAHWDGAQGQAKMVKITQNTPTYDVPHRKPQAKNEKLFFLMSTRRLAESVGGFEQL